MTNLHDNGTWKIVHLPHHKATIRCHWMFIVKIKPDGKVDRLKACLVSKEKTQIYNLDYGDSFSQW